MILVFCSLEKEETEEQKQAETGSEFQRIGAVKVKALLPAAAERPTGIAKVADLEDVRVHLGF